jgi:hypothetical protein
MTSNDRKWIFDAIEAIAQETDHPILHEDADRFFKCVKELKAEKLDKLYLVTNDGSINSVCTSEQAAAEALVKAGYFKTKEEVTSHFEKNNDFPYIQEIPANIVVSIDC